MPTTRPRLTITETDDVARALDAAAARWPEVGSRRELLLRLVAHGREAIDRDRHVLDHEVKAVTRHGLSLTGQAGAWVAEMILDI